MLVLFEAVGADFDPAAGGQRGPLEIGLLPVLSGGVIFGGSDAVRVTADHQAPFVA